MIIPGALSREQLGDVRKAFGRLYRKSRQETGPDQMDIRNILGEDQVFIDLIDPDTLFEVVLDLVGPYIQLSLAQALVRSPDPKNAGYVHADGGQAVIRVTESSLPLQIKIQYFLTDVRGSDQGNFIVYPGSHFRPLPGNATQIEKTKLKSWATQNRIPPRAASISPHHRRPRIRPSPK